MLPPTFDPAAGPNPIPPARRRMRFANPQVFTNWKPQPKAFAGGATRRAPQVRGTHRLVFIDGVEVSRLRPGKGQILAVAVLELPAIFPHVADTPTNSQHMINTALEWIRWNRFRATMRVDRDFPRRLRMLR